MDYKKLAQELLSKAPVPRNKPNVDVNNLIKGEMAVLGCLHSENKPMLASEISSAVGISSGRLATVLRALEEKGQIERQRDEEDRRRVWVVISESGVERIKRQFGNCVNFVADILAELGEEDAKELVRIYSRFEDILGKKLAKDDEK